MRLDVTSRNVEVFLFTNQQGTGYVSGDPVTFGDLTGLDKCKDNQNCVEVVAKADPIPSTPAPTIGFDPFWGWLIGDINGINLTYMLRSQKEDLARGARERQDDAYCSRALGNVAHEVLGVASLVPALGELAAGVDGLIYLSEEDYVNAGISAAAMLPLVGDAAIAAKYGEKVTAASKAILEWLGKDAQVIITNSGRDLYLASKDLTKRIGFDLSKPHGYPGGPHANVEEWAPLNRYAGDKAMDRIANIHACPK